MNHFPHHIGDFNNATRHLTFVERALYRELLDLYYDTERPLIRDVDKLARRVLANTPELRTALNIILDEFFQDTPEGWRNRRCDREIEAYTQKQEQQSRAGRASAAKRGVGRGGKGVPPAPKLEARADGELNGRSTGVEQAFNQPEPEPEPINTPQPPSRGADAAMVIAKELMGFFPEKRRTRVGEVAEKIAALQVDGVVQPERLLAAAAQQSAVLGEDDGKACPSVLRWLREGRWRDTWDGLQGASAAGLPGNWSATRSGVEAMGQRLGLGPWDEQADRLFASYERRVHEALKAQGEVCDG